MVGEAFFPCFSIWLLYVQARVLSSVRVFEGFFVKQLCRERERERETDRDRETERQRDRDRETEREKERQRERQRERERKRETERKRKRERERERERSIDKNPQQSYLRIHLLILRSQLSQSHP